MNTKFYLTLVAVVAGLCICIGAFAFLFLEYVLPLSRDFALAKRTIAVAESKINSVEKIVAPSIKRAKSDLDAIGNSFYTPTDAAAYDFILFIESLGKENGVVQKILTPPSDISYSASIQVSGRFADVMKFLYALENSSYLVRIDTLSLQASGDAMSANIAVTLQKP